jgi:hypothetical protein
VKADTKLFSALALQFAMSTATFGDSQAVVVNDVEELYAAVSDPANVGVTIQLSPGTYALTPFDPSGQPRSNRGSLLLQNGMRLRGENAYVDRDGDGVFDPRDDNGDGFVDLDQEGRETYADPQTETIIDGTQLMVPDPGAGVVSGAILVAGPVEVSISNLTVRGGPRAQAAIDVRGPGNDLSNVTVTECTLERGRRGILIDASIRWGSTGASVNLSAERNIIREHRVDHLFPGIYFGWGIHTQAVNASAVQLSARISHNRFTQNKLGLLLESMGMDDGQTTIVSQMNIYENSVLTTDPVLGSVFSGGIHIELRNFGARGSRRNRTHLISINDRIWNNEGWAGLYVKGIRRTANDTEFIDNEIDVQLLGTEFVKLTHDGTFDGLQNREARVDASGGDQSMRRRDVVIVGANNSGGNLRNPPAGGLTGPARGNRVKLLVRGVMSSLMPTSYDPDPVPLLIDDNSPNEVAISVVGSPAFQRTNTGLEGQP